MSMHKNFSRTAIFVALSAIFPATAVHADDDVEALTNPNAIEAALKLPFIDKINPLYRQYNGINHQGLNGNLDLNVVNRNDEGSWFKLRAENLGLSTQEFGVSYERQGDWAVGLEYNQIPRYAPYQVSTAVSGIGGNNLTQKSYANSDFSNGVLRNPNLFETTLKTEREITSLTASKYLLDGLKLSLSFKNEDKTGVRMNGMRGSAGTGTPNLYSGLLFAPEPIDQNHQQYEATLDYSTRNYQLSAGYYGSVFTNRFSYLNVVGGTNTAVSASSTPVALAPDNTFHQLFVNGAYNFSADTRANIKVAYSEGRQTDGFINGSGLTLPSGSWATQAGIGSNLDAKVQTTEVFGSLSSKITRDLKLLASWRYEDKQDKTPVRLFYTSGGTNYYNNPESHQANWGKLEADYRLAAGYGLTAGVDYRSKKSLEWERKEVEEVTYRAALRKTMSETVNGTLALSHAERTGSDWNGGSAPLIYPVFMSDRKRDKVRGMLDWTAAENLSLQFAYEAYFDDYDKSSYGLDKGQGQVFSLDGSYALSDNWKLNAWYSRQHGENQQTSYGSACTSDTTACAGATGSSANSTNKFVWNANLKQDGDQFGFGLNGRIQKLEIGASYSYVQDQNKQEIGLPSSFTKTVGATTSATTLMAGSGVLPDTKYIQNTFRLFGIYPLSKDTRLRLDYIYDLRKMDDYTWKNWVYADGTRVFVKPDQTTQILGLSLIQPF